MFAHIRCIKHLSDNCTSFRIVACLAKSMLYNCTGFITNTNARLRIIHYPSTHTMPATFRVRSGAVVDPQGPLGMAMVECEACRLSVVVPCFFEQAACRWCPLLLPRLAGGNGICHTVFLHDLPLGPLTTCTRAAQNDGKNPIMEPPIDSPVLGRVHNMLVRLLFFEATRTSNQSSHLCGSLTWMSALCRGRALPRAVVPGEVILPGSVNPVVAMLVQSFGAANRMSPARGRGSSHNVAPLAGCDRTSGLPLPGSGRQSTHTHKFLLTMATNGLAGIPENQCPRRESPPPKRCRLCRELVTQGTCEGAGLLATNFFQSGRRWTEMDKDALGL